MNLSWIFKESFNPFHDNDCPYLVMGEPKIVTERPLQLWPRKTSNSFWPTLGHLVKTRFIWFSIQSKFFHYKITTIIRKIIFFSESDAFASAVVEELGFLAKVQENIPEQFEHLFDENCSKTPKSDGFVSTKTQNNKRWMFGKWIGKFRSYKFQIILKLL